MKNGLLESARGLSWPKTAGTKEGLRISRGISFIPDWMAVYCRSHRLTSNILLRYLGRCYYGSSAIILLGPHGSTDGTLGDTNCFLCHTDCLEISNVSVSELQ